MRKEERQQLLSFQFSAKSEGARFDERPFLRLARNCPPLLDHKITFNAPATDCHYDDTVNLQRLRREALMDRAELLAAASHHLTAAIILLTAAGEDRLALDVEEIAEWVDFSSVPFNGEISMPQTSH
ncbi:MAG TPA: hypothetical protein VHK26_12665 [Methyloceanibacter sp.]|nr:hypothetical protein [Methyloceanibacter sp.]